MAKRAVKRMGTIEVDTGTAELRQHVRVKTDLAVVREGRTARATRVLRTVDTLDDLRAAGEITEAMYRAGREFQRSFAIAGLDPLRAINWDRIAGSSPKVESDAILQARRRVDRMIKWVGGGRSAPGQALYWVVGAGLSYADFARRISWAGRVMDQRVVKGLVVAALSVLAPSRRAWAGDEMARPECWIILHRYETGFASLAESLAAADRLPDEEARAAVREALNSAVSRGAENTT